MKKKPTFGTNILASYLGEQKNCYDRKENKFDRLLLFSRVAGPFGRRDCSFWVNVIDKVTAHPFNIWAGKCYVFVRRSANINLTQLTKK